MFNGLVGVLSAVGLIQLGPTLLSGEILLMLGGAGGSILGVVGIDPIGLSIELGTLGVDGELLSVEAHGGFSISVGVLGTAEGVAITGSLTVATGSGVGGVTGSGMGGVGAGEDGIEAGSGIDGVSGILGVDGTTGSGLGLGGVTGSGMVGVESGSGVEAGLGVAGVCVFKSAPNGVVGVEPSVGWAGFIGSSGIF